MPTRNDKPEQIVAVLRQIEVQMANGEDSTPRLQRSRNPRPELLPVAEGIWRAEAGSGETAEGIEEGERSPEATGRGAVAGEAGWRLPRYSLNSFLSLLLHGFGAPAFARNAYGLARLMSEFSDGFFTVVAATAMLYWLCS